MLCLDRSFPNVLYRGKDKHYYISFKDGQGVLHKLEISKALYDAFDSFELDDLIYLNVVDRHIVLKKIQIEALHTAMKRLPEMPFKEQEIPGYNYQFATDRVVTGSRDNDTPVQSKVERKCPLGMKVSQQMRAAPGDPRRGTISVELVSSQTFGDFPMFIVKTVDMKAGVSRTNRLIRLKMVAGHNA